MWHHERRGPIITFILILATIITFTSQGQASSPTVQPSTASARKHATRIFNAVHAAGRLFPSSLAHNGFSFFPATIPRGTLLYHGSRARVPPREPQWLAFEIEHAETFAVSKTAERRNAAKGEGPPEGVRTEEQKRREAEYEEKSGRKARGNEHENGNGEGVEDDGEWNSRGYLHTYQALRPLTVLYIDGMSAAKSKKGPLDSQDLLLRGNKTGDWADYMDEGGRAGDICALITPWGYDGFVRMEIGFELVYCDFSSGMGLVSATRTLMPRDKLAEGELYLYQLARAVGQQFEGLGKGRLEIDYSSMVSAFYFPVDISNTDDARPDLLRLESVSLEKLKDMRNHLERVFTRPKTLTLDWQAITDTIVSRFADRVSWMVSETISSVQFVQELQVIALTYYDAERLANDMPDKGSENETATMVVPVMDPESVAGSEEQTRIEDAKKECKGHHLLPATLMRESWTPEDELVHAALEVVTGAVCNAILDIYDALAKAHLDSAENALEKVIADSKAQMKDLMQALDWAEWKKTRRCPVDQIWFVSMYPYGTDDDHWSPGCRTVDEMKFPRVGYWDLDYFLDKQKAEEEAKLGEEGARGNDEL